MTIDEIQKELIEKSGNNPEFFKNISKSDKLVHGVRVPELRKMAKRIAKEDYQWFLQHNPMDSLELEMLQAFVIGYAKDDIDTILKYFEEFMPLVTNWAVNDALCQTFSISRKYQKETWDMLMKYQDTEEEFLSRVVSITLMSHFLNDEYIDRVIEVYDHISTNAYYSKMGVAWAIATVMAKYPEKCYAYMKRPDNHLDDWTYNKAIQKMRESYRVSDEMKEIMKAMKR